MEIPFDHDANGNVSSSSCESVISDSPVIILDGSYLSLHTPKVANMMSRQKYVLTRGEMTRPWNSDEIWHESALLSSASL